MRHTDLRTLLLLMAKNQQQGGIRIRTETETRIKSEIFSIKPNRHKIQDIPSPNMIITNQNSDSIAAKLIYHGISFLCMESGNS